MNSKTPPPLKMRPYRVRYRMVKRIEKWEISIPVLNRTVRYRTGIYRRGWMTEEMLWRRCETRLSILHRDGLYSLYSRRKRKQNWSLMSLESHQVVLLACKEDGPVTAWCASTLSPVGDGCLQCLRMAEHLNYLQHRFLPCLRTVQNWNAYNLLQFAWFFCASLRRKTCILIHLSSLQSCILL
jgi:hypothetical protein